MKIYFLFLSLILAMPIIAMRNAIDEKTAQSAFLADEDYNTESESENETEAEEVVTPGMETPSISMVINSTVSSALINFYDAAHLRYYIVGPANSLNSVFRTATSLDKDFIIAAKGQVYKIEYNTNTNTIELKIFSGDQNHPFEVIKSFANPSSGKVFIDMSEHNPEGYITIKPLSR